MDKNDYLIDIVGTQQIDDDPQQVIEVTTIGEYKLSPTGSIFIRYKEYDEDNVTFMYDTMVKATKDMVTITKGTSKDTQLILELDKLHQCCYLTPAGPMIIGVYTSNIEIKQEKDVCIVKAEYTLNFDSHNVSNNTFTIKIRKNNRNK